MNYFDALTEAMTWLGNKKDTYFIGQAVGCAGTGISNTLKNVDISKRLELPVAEEMQLGMSLGMSLEGIVPISIFPRWNFIICAMNQLVNHVDKYSLMGYPSKIIIRVSVGSERPLHPSFQHVGDFTDAVKMMCNNIKFFKLDEPEKIIPSYKEAYQSNCPSILVEWGDYYNEK